MSIRLIPSTIKHPPAPIKTVAKQHVPQKRIVGLPVRLKIPELSIDTAIEHVGLTSDGAMDATKNPATVAWYRLGPHPGELGSAVIAGHYGWQDGKASFNTLHTLKAGSEVSIEDTNGAGVNFVVRSSRIYDPNADAVSVFWINRREVSS